MSHVAATVAGTSAATRRRVAMVRIAIIALILVGWEALSLSGLLFRDVVPSLTAIGRAIARLFANADFYANLGITVGEIGIGLLIGGVCGLATGILLGANRFLSRAYESLI
jgi:ABC-type nitrate/sulfonate/bicarbonate transport system permease component